uniref:Uncharacterized protein n=1 Tax=Molossus molossus TaxID=27622 RepID=A0A7J8ESM4_MOLMO|nr:hypothetical protein HJG59_008733 [Molossus molossus]
MDGRRVGGEALASSANWLLTSLPSVLRPPRDTLTKEGQLGAGDPYRWHFLMQSGPKVSGGGRGSGASTVHVCSLDSQGLPTAVFAGTTLLGRSPAGTVGMCVIVVCVGTALLYGASLVLQSPVALVPTPWALTGSPTALSVLGIRWFSPPARCSPTAGHWQSCLPRCRLSAIGGGWAPPCQLAPICSGWLIRCPLTTMGLGWASRCQLSNVGLG